MNQKKYAVLMLQKGLTQKHIADEMNSYQSHVNAWLNGKRSPSYNKLVKLADILQMTTDELAQELEKISNL